MGEKPNDQHLNIQNVAYSQVTNKMGSFRTNTFEFMIRSQWQDEEEVYLFVMLVCF